MSQANNVLLNNQAKSQQDAATAALSSEQLKAAIEMYKKTGDLNAAIASVKSGQTSTMTDRGKELQAGLDRINANPNDTMGGQREDFIKKITAELAAETGRPGVSQNDLSSAIRNQMFADPETGSMLASQQVMSNPLSSGMFGKGGIQDQRQADEQNLTKTAYDWNAQDETAFGTAAGNINRQYGAEQGNLARALSSRGFGSADSGIAGQQFSGLQGNTSDRLAAAQQNLANNRMQVGMQRLTAARNAVNQAQGMAQGAMTDQFNRNMVGLNRGDKQIANSWGMAQDQQKQNNTAWQQNEDSTINPMKILSGVVTSAGSNVLGNVLGGGKGKPLGSADNGTPYTNVDSNGNVIR